MPSRSTEAQSEINAKAGLEFDPDVVAVFLGLDFDAGTDS